MEADAGPTASVIVPVYNDPDGLEMTLDSLIAQSYPTEEHEVLVVDNDSTDGTRELAARYAERHDHVEVLIEDERQSSYAARNTGIERAAGSVIAFVDADMTVPNAWLADVTAEMAAADADYMACDVELYSPGQEESLAAKFNRLSGFPIRRYVERRHFAPTCCLVVRRSVFEDVGLFDDRLVSSGDREFGHRVHDSGCDLHYAPDITMYHPTRSSVRALVSKAVRIGRGTYQLSERYPDRYGSTRELLTNSVTYLPPVPWLLDEALAEWESLPLGQRVGFYLLAAVTSYSRTYGKIREAVH